ncbi:MAG: transcription factor S [Candidatus Lokiarchaeota archaeon]|nr:transcription factor S [Candidatus Lokiarchaeota archaeon]
MQFCDECGAMMVPFTKEDGTRVLRCRSCGYIENPEGDMMVSQPIEKTPRDKIIVVEDDSIPMPITKASCPKCGHNEAYYWTLQTRRGDEGATEFYRCTKCSSTWRRY